MGPAVTISTPESSPLCPPRPACGGSTDFVLDTQRYELRSDGDVIRVEPQVFDVLTQLISNHHRFVSKEELFDSVWGGRFVGEAALTSRIKAARRALGDDGESQRYIRTVRGRGYQFVGTILADAPPEAVPEARAARRAAAAAPAHRVLPGRRRCPARVRRCRGGAAACAGGELDDPPRVRHREPGVETLGARLVAQPPDSFATTSVVVVYLTGMQQISRSTTG